MQTNFRGAALAAVVLGAGTAAFARTAAKELSRRDAERRAALVKNPEYELALSLDGESEKFTGREALRFTLEAPADDLTVDFAGGKIESLTVNGQRVAEPDGAGTFFSLPKSLLRAGVNVVETSFSHPYAADPAGLYRFKDPEDGRVYLFTNFEPYDASKVFPCFDQPDLKATYALSVDAPGDWRVISASAEETVAASGARRTWTFGRTPRLSTYVFSVDAGPFHVWTSSAGAIPLRLFARESLAQYVPAREWLELTRRGFDFYGGYLDLPYPFQKYDQLLVPDIERDMENAGAVTFSDDFVLRSTQTPASGDAILHEMAHAWFGDLVTMKWWDGLWLNESFATYMSGLSLNRATPDRRAWRGFFVAEKRRAYAMDELAATGPIERNVPDTGQAFGPDFDITYGKGAAVLMQLSDRLGEGKFRAGLRLYLKTHAYGSVEAKDFFGAMSRASGEPLDAWTHQWMETAGVNTVRADYKCGADGLTSSFALIQTAPADHPALRRHRAEVALYRAGSGGLWEVSVSIPVDYDGARTEVPALVGRECPVLVDPNHDGQDYAKTELDARSLAAVKTGLARIPDPLLRATLWNALWDMVRDAKWPADRYAELILANLGRETDITVADAVLQTVYGPDNASPSVLNYLPRPDYARFEAFFLAALAKAKPGGDFQGLWFDGYLKVAASPAGVERLRGWLGGASRVEGLGIGQGRRWSIIERLSELGAPDAESLIASEVRRDPSDAGAKAAITARAARPDPASKKAWFARISDPKSTASLDDLRAAMADFFPRTQAELRAQFRGPFFRTLPELDARKDAGFLDAYGRAMIPALCTPGSAAALGDYVAKTPPSRPFLLRALRGARQEDERCVKIRARISR